MRKGFEAMGMFITLIMVIVHGCMHMSKHQIAYIKYVQYSICQLYLNKTVKKGIDIDQWDGIGNPERSLHIYNQFILFTPNCIVLKM